MSEPQFTVTVHLEGGCRSLQYFHSSKAARHYAKQACGRPDVERITLDSPGVACELWSKHDAAPAPTALPAAFATIERALPNRTWQAGRSR